MDLWKFFRTLDSRTFGFVWFWGVVSLLYCLVFTSIEFSDYPVDGFRSFLALVAQWGIVAVCTSGLIALLALSRWVFAFVFPAFCGFSAAIGYYQLSLGTGLTPTAIELAMVNGASMWLSLVDAGLMLSVIIGLLCGAMAAVARWKYVTLTRRTVMVSAVLGAVLMLLPFVVGRLYAPVMSRMPFAIYESTRVYLANRRNYEEHRDTYTHVPAQAAPMPPDVIFILGESLRADHLPQNGYTRNTMPLLNREPRAVSFPNLYSDATYTHTSIPVIMTGADSPDDERAYTSQSFVTLFRNAGYRTCWVANQEICSSYAYFAHECDSLVLTDNAVRSMYSYDSWMDTDMYPHLDRLLAGVTSPRLIILHSIGSHWWYRSHYADRHRRFRPDIGHKDISFLTHEELTNAYDNTIIATDEFLYGVLERVKGRNCIVVYISDHGESLGENGIYLHGQEERHQHYPACIVWWSEEYEHCFPDKTARIRQAAKERGNTSQIFHTLLDLGGIATPALVPSRSLAKDTK